MIYNIFDSSGINKNKSIKLNKILSKVRSKNKGNLRNKSRMS